MTDVSEQSVAEVTLAECPPGLFVFNGSYGFRSEYGTDAYCLESGEYFSGGTNGGKAIRAALLVEPVTLKDLIADREAERRDSLMLMELFAKERLKVEGLQEALNQIIGEGPSRPVGDKPTVGFQPSHDPEQDDGNETVEEAFREGVARGLWEAAEIASAALLAAPRAGEGVDRG